MEEYLYLRRIKDNINYLRKELSKAQKMYQKVLNSKEFEKHGMWLNNYFDWNFLSGNKLFFYKRVTLEEMQHEYLKMKDKLKDYKVTDVKPLFYERTGNLEHALTVIFDDVELELTLTMKYTESKVLIMDEGYEEPESLDNV